MYLGILIYFIEYNTKFMTYIRAYFITHLTHIIIFVYIVFFIIYLLGVILTTEDFFVYASSGNGNGDLGQGLGPPSPGGAPGGPHNSQDISVATSGESSTRHENTENLTNCSYMYTYRNELLGTCGRGGSGPYSSSDITIFSNKFITTMNNTGEGLQ